MKTEKFTIMNLNRTEMEVMREYIRALNYKHKHHKIEFDIYCTAQDKFNVAVDNCVSTESRRIIDFMKLMFQLEEEVSENV